MTTKLQPHPHIKGLYIAHDKGTYRGEVARLRERQFLVRGAQRQLLSTECPSLGAAVAMLDRQ